MKTLNETENQIVKYRPVHVVPLDGRSPFICGVCIVYENNFFYVFYNVRVVPILEFLSEGTWI